MCNKENKVRFHINWKIRVTSPQENRESEGTVKETPVISKVSNKLDRLSKEKSSRTFH